MPISEMMNTKMGKPSNSVSGNGPVVPKDHASSGPKWSWDEVGGQVQDGGRMAQLSQACSTCCEIQSHLHFQPGGMGSRERGTDNATRLAGRKRGHT